MKLRACAEPGCPALQAEARCLNHRRAYERGRGTRQQRGYDADHDRLRATYQRRMDARERFNCWRCLDPIDSTAWTLGHCDDDRRLYHGPECPPCDYATAGRQRCPHGAHRAV